MITMKVKKGSSLNILLKVSLLFYLQAFCAGSFYQVPVDRREDCGFPGITPQQCFERNCIWDDNTPDAPWCYNVIGEGELPNEEPIKGSMFTQLTDAFVQYSGDCLFQCTSIHRSIRQACSAVAINMQSCLREGCCWDETGSDLQCYHPDETITEDECPTDAECQAADGQIELCSTSATTEAECTREGCCFFVIKNQPLCYKRQPSAIIVGNTTSNVDRPFKAILKEEGKELTDFSLYDLLKKSPQELFPTEPPTTTTEKPTTTTLVSTTERIITVPTEPPIRQKKVCKTRFFKKTCSWVDITPKKPEQCIPKECGKPKYFPGSTQAKVDARDINSNLSKAMDKKKIVGGTRAYPFSHPWTAMLLKKEGKRGFLCGASVICEHWLVTAAHCMNRQTSKTNVPDLDTIFYTIQVGRHNGLDEEHGEQVQTFSGREDIDYIELHPNFTSGVSRGIITNDIAVIRLKKPIKFDDYVQPICLPEVRASVDTILWAAGWGITKGRGPTNAKLKQLGVKIFNESACVDKVPKFKDNKPQGVLCAGGEVDQDTCTGDSGGPLAGPIWVTEDSGSWFRARKRSYQWQLYGLTSIGSPNCNTLSFDRQPAVYTDVAYFSDWVKKQTQNCCR